MFNFSFNSLKFLIGERGRGCLVLLAFILLATIINAQVAFGQSYQNLSIGNAKALALANAVTADPPTIDSLHFNPAGLYNSVPKGKTYSIQAILSPKPELTIGTQWTGEYPDANLFINDCNTECVLNNEQGFEMQRHTIEGFPTYIPGKGESERKNVFPRGGFIYKGERLAFGIGPYVTFGAGLETPANEEISFPKRKLAAINLVMAAPGIAIKVNEQLTIGGSIPIHYLGVLDDSRLRLPNLAIALLSEGIESLCDVGSIEVCTEDGESIPLYDEAIAIIIEGEDRFTPSFNLGFLWSPLAWLSVGGVYQSKVDHIVEGDFEIRYHPSFIKLFQTGLLSGLPNAPQLEEIPDNYVERGKSQVVQSLPRHISLGLSAQVTSKLKFNFDIKRTDFSIIDIGITKFDRPTFLAALSEVVNGTEPFTTTKPIGYRDGWNFSQGIEYLWSHSLSLRLGYEWRESVIPEGSRIISSPLGDTKVMSFGFKYSFNHDFHLEFAAANISSYQYIPSGTSFSNSWDPGQLYVTHPGYNLETNLESNVFILSFTQHLH